jgi:hypothetical protein
MSDHKTENPKTLCVWNMQSMYVIIVQMTSTILHKDDYQGSFNG